MMYCTYIYHYRISAFWVVIESVIYTFFKPLNHKVSVDFLGIFFIAIANSIKLIRKKR